MMETMFPFGFPFATGFYLVFYVLTLVLHVVWMNYVLAGTGYVTAVSMVSGGGRGVARSRRAAEILRDWLPFGLSAAITAGVAPLLFVQILYQKSFYTANLLLLHRWMAIVPVLIVGFYLLYVLKIKAGSGWPAPARVAVGLGAFACFAFTGWSWTENHLLSQQSELWPAFYGAGKRMYHSAELWPRLGMLLAGSVPTMVVMVSWQLRAAGRRGEAVGRQEIREMSVLALGGLAVSLVFGLWYGAVMNEAARACVMSVLAWPYLGLALVGAAVQAAAWLKQRKEAEFSGRWLGLATVGVLLTLVGMTVVREAIRLARVDIASLYEEHASAAEVGGVTVFLAFFVINALLIVWCVLMVRGPRPTVAAL